MMSDRPQAEHLSYNVRGTGCTASDQSYNAYSTQTQGQGVSEIERMIVSYIIERDLPNIVSFLDPCKHVSDGM